MTWRAQLIGKPGVLTDATLRPALAKRGRGEVGEAWEHYWRWADARPEALRPKTADL